MKTSKNSKKNIIEKLNIKEDTYNNFNTQYLSECKNNLNVKQNNLNDILIFHVVKDNISIQQTEEYKEGNTTIRMFSEEQVINAAKLMWKTIIIEPKLLILGTDYVMEPQQIIDYASNVDVKKVNRINELTELRKSLNWDKDEDELDNICDEWEKIFFKL